MLPLQALEGDRYFLGLSVFFRQAHVLGSTVKGTLPLGLEQAVLHGHDWAFRLGLACRKDVRATLEFRNRCPRGPLRWPLPTKVGSSTMPPTYSSRRIYAILQKLHGSRFNILANPAGINIPIWYSTCILSLANLY
jgi:hypothetical protein